MNWRLTGLAAVLLATLGISMVIRDQAEPKQANKRPPNIAFITGGSNAFWQLTVNGARAAAKEDGAELQVLMPEHDEDVEEQNQLLLRLDKDQLDGLAVSPLNAEQQTRILSRLSQHALVVTFDSDAPLSTRMTYIGASNLTAGRKAAELVHQAAPGGGQVAVLVANLTKDNTVQRKQGFEEAINELPGTDGEQADDQSDEGGRYQVVDVLVDRGDDAVCKRQVTELLDAHPDLAAIVGMNARHGPILVDTLKEVDRLNSVKLVVFDDAPETLQGVEDGSIYATIVQDPYHYGFEAVRTLVTLYHRPEEQLPIAGALNVVPIATQAVLKGNLENYKAVQAGLADAPE